jgi:hypothetical protein
MHHTVIWIHADCTAAKPLVTHRTMPVFINNNSAIQTTGHDFSIATHFPISQQHRLDDSCFFHSS